MAKEAETEVRRLLSIAQGTSPPSFLARLFRTKSASTAVRAHAVADMGRLLPDVLDPQTRTEVVKIYRAFPDEAEHVLPVLRLWVKCRTDPRLDEIRSSPPYVLQLVPTDLLVPANLQIQERLVCELLRSRTAQLLGEMGLGAKDALPDLAEALANEKDPTTRMSIEDAIERISS